MDLFAYLGIQNSINAGATTVLHQCGAGDQVADDLGKAKGTVCAGGKGLQVHCVHVLACQQACQGGRIEACGDTCSRTDLQALSQASLPFFLAAHPSKILMRKGAALWKRWAWAQTAKEPWC